MLKNRLLVCVRMFFILVLSLLMISCSVQTPEGVNPEKYPELVDQSWLTDKPCSAPCWQGIEPGISSRQDAIQAVQEMSFVDGENMRTYNASNIGFLCRAPSDIACVAMGFDDDMLSDIRLYINYQLSIKDVVDKLGPPDSYIIIRPRPETKGCDVEFLWINRQLSVEYHEKPHTFGDDLCDTTDEKSGKIPKELYVQNVNYMGSSQMNEKIQTAQKSGTGYNYILWKGLSE